MQIVTSLDSSAKFTFQAQSKECYKCSFWTIGNDFVNGSWIPVNTTYPTNWKLSNGTELCSVSRIFSGLCSDFVLSFFRTNIFISSQLRSTRRQHTRSFTLFSGGFYSSIFRKTHFAITWPIFFKIQILTLPGLKNLQLQPWQCQNLNFEQNWP